MTARYDKMTRRLQRARKRAAGRVFSSPGVVLSITLPFLLSGAVRAQAPTPPATAPTAPINAPHISGLGSVGTAGLSVLGQNIGKERTGVTAGHSFSEVLRGNGSRLGYTLSHGNILTSTISLRVNGSLLKSGQDYFLDPDSGALYFSQTVRPGDSISVYYRYEDGAGTQRSSLGIPGLQLNFGGSTALNLAFGTSMGEGTSTSLYGLNLNSKFGGGGLSTYSGLAYFANTTQTGNLKMDGSKPGAKAPGAPDPSKSGVDHLITQSLNAQSGLLRAHADFQDIGKNFSGFNALKSNAANDKAMLARLTQLEAEKGVQRLGFGFGIGLNPKSKTPDGLSFDLSNIHDDKGSISQQNLGFVSQNLHFNYANRAVSQDFSQFKGLREADKAQWEREKGLHTSSMGFGLNFGSSKKGAAPGTFDFASQSFGDKSGGLSRESLGFNLGSVNVQRLASKADKGFTRLNDLSDADKTALALDLYRQYDPTARPEQVTAADKAQVVKAAGFSRDSLRLNSLFGKSGGFAISQLRLSDAAASQTAQATGLQRDSLNLNTGAFNLDYTRRKTDKDFTRIADLADVEKTALALDIRRQFDPDAKAAQVVQVERDQATKEAGLSREFLNAKMLLGKAGKNGFLSFNHMDLAQLVGGTTKETLGALHRYQFGYTGKALQFTLLNQNISNHFSRLTDLSNVERAQFGNEHGLAKRQFGLAWQLNKLSKLSVNSLRVGAVEDAIKDALTAAEKDSKSQSDAARRAASGLSREKIAFETKNIAVSANFANTDKDFTRSTDLALTDVEKAAVETERGYRRSDYAAHFAAVKGLTFDGTLYSSANAVDKLSHDTHKFNLQYAVNKSIGLTYTDDSDIATANGLRNGIQHSLLTYNQGFNKGYLVNLSHDQTATYSSGVETVQTSTDYLHFETPKDKRNGLSFDQRRLAYSDSRYENNTNLNVHVKPNSQLTFTYSRSETERGQDTPAETAATGTTTPTTPVVAAGPSESTDSFDFQFQANKQFAIVAGLTQRDTTDKKDGDTVKFGLQGQPIKDFNVAATFNEIHDNAKNTKDVADFAISNAKPFSLGPLKEITFTARYASLNDQRKLQNETMTGRASWKIWKNEFLLDYSGLSQANGTSTVSRLYQVATDPNPKKWFHGGFLYKVRTLATGEEKLIRRFTADWRFAKNTNFVYTYGTLPEDDKGNLTPLTTADVAFKHAWRSTLTSQIFYRLSDNQATKVATSSFGFGVDTVFSKTVKFGIAYSKEINGQAGVFDHSDHLHVSLDHQINSDHFLTVSAEIRSHDSHNLQDEIQTNLDFRTRF
jgi:hypothetical protein